MFAVNRCHIDGRKVEQLQVTHRNQGFGGNLEIDGRRVSLGNE